MSTVSKLKSGLKSTLGRVLRKADPTNHIPESTWHCRYENQKLMLRNHMLTDLAKQYGTPLHVVDEVKLRKNVTDMLTVDIDGHRPEVFFSYKTQPINDFIRIIHECGAGAEVISDYELWLALKIGVPANRIIYNGPAKTDASLKKAVTLNLDSINVNSLSELQRLVSFAQAAKNKVRVGIRAQSAAGWTSQFGIVAGSTEFNDAWHLAKTSKWLDPVMAHVHHGISLRSAEQTKKHASQVLAVADMAEDIIGHTLEAIDFGGSLATPTVRWLTPKNRKMSQAFAVCAPAPDDWSSALTPGAYAKVITETCVAHRTSVKKPVPRIILEPGRGISGNSTHLLLSVIDVKPDRPADYLIMDGGINVAEILRNERHQIFHCSKPHSYLKTYRLAGPLCTPGDIVSLAQKLPATSRDDVLCVMDSGAYFEPFSSSFSFPRAATVSVSENAPPSVLRAAETYLDICDRDHFFVKN